MLEGDSWGLNLGFLNYSTAVETRSLSIRLLPAANGSSSVSLAGSNSTDNIALLYYENPNGKVSALLNRILRLTGTYGQIQWVDVTSQESKALPREFRPAGWVDHDTIASDPNTTRSHTLYDTDPNIVYSTPFTSAANFWGGSAGALFYSPLDPLLNTTSPFAGSFFNVGYNTGSSGPGNFTVSGMHYLPAYTALFFVK